MTDKCPRCCANCAKWMPLSTPSERAGMLVGGDYKEVFVYDLGVCRQLVEHDYLFGIRCATAPITSAELADMVDDWIKPGSASCLGYKSKEVADA